MTDRRTTRRDRTLEVEPLDGGGFVFEARLIDTSRSGHHEPPAATAIIHEFRVTGEVQGIDLRLTALEVEALTHPYPQCPFVIPVCANLIGSSLSSGWRASVLDGLGGPAGCTHLVSLLLSLTELTTLIFFLRINETVPYGPAQRADGTWNAAGLDAVPTLADACHVLVSDGSVLARAREHRSARP